MYTSVNRIRARRTITEPLSDLPRFVLPFGPDHRRQAHPRCPQPVPSAANGLDQPISPATVELSTQAADVDLDDIRPRDRVGAPQRGDEVLLRENLTGVTREELEKGELAGRQPNRVTVALDAERRWVDHKITDPDQGGTPFRRTASQRADPRFQLGDRERLGQVVIGPFIQPRHAILDARQRGQHQDRCSESVLAQLSTDVETGHAVQDHIEDDETVWGGSGPGDCVRTAGNGVDRMPVVDQRHPERGGDGGLVLHDQDSQGWASPAGRRNGRLDRVHAKGEAARHRTVFLLAESRLNHRVATLIDDHVLPARIRALEQLGDGRGPSATPYVGCGQPLWTLCPGRRRGSRDNV